MATARRATDPLVGRETELGRIREELDGGPCWLSIGGLPGVGKTALLRAVATELASKRRRARWGDASSLADAQEGDVVLVDELDDETVTTFAPLAQQARARGVSILSAGTHSAGIGEGRLVRLAPLAVPRLGDDDETALATPAACVLLAAARRLDAEPVLDAAGLVSLRAVLVASSGLPLVLEMIASNLLVLSLADIATALASPSGFAASASGPRPARHGRLGDAFAPMLGRLTSDARAHLLEASPFRTDLDPPPVGSPALGAMRSLIDLGLVESDRDEAGRVRLRVPVLVGRMVLERASDVERAEVSRRHVEDVARRVSAHVADYELRGEHAALTRLASLGPDVDAALAWVERTDALDVSLVDDAVRLTTGAGRARGTGTSDDVLARLERLARRLDPPPASSIVRLAIERAGNAERATRVDEARASLDRAAHLVSSASPAARAELAMARGRHALAIERDYAAARAHFQEAAESEDLGVRGRALVSVGNGFAWSERYEEAAEEYARALEVIRGTGATRLETIVLTNLCLIHAGHWPSERSRTPRTVRLEDGRRAVGLFRAAQDRVGLGIASTHVAITATTVLRFETAEDEFLASLEALDGVGSPTNIVVAMVDLGDVRHALGDDAGARVAYARGREVADRAGDHLMGAVARAQEGNLAIERGELSVAREHLESARNVLGTDGAHANQLGLALAHLALVDRGAAPALLARAKELVGTSASAQRHAVDVYALLVAHREGRLATAELDAIATPWLRATLRLMRAPEASRGEDGYGIPWHVWVAVRRLLRELDVGSRRRLLEVALGLDRESRRALVIDVDRRAVRALDGTWIDLANRPRPFALLAALADAAHARASSSVTDLVARVWPDERMLPTAGANRVYAAISTLRKAGDLADLIVREADGYRLAPGLETSVWRDDYLATRPARVVPTGLGASTARPPMPTPTPPERR